MKHHLKRLTAPRQWNVSRKGTTFLLRPKPGAHSLELGLPLGMILRDVLHLTQTLAEAKKLLHGQQILVDGIRRTDHRFIIGLFDVLSIVPLKRHYRMLLDGKGRLALLEISPAESALKLCKVVGKSVLPGGTIQYHLHDGRNMLMKASARIGDTLVLTLPGFQVKDIIPGTPGAAVFLIKGRYSGDFGVLKNIKGAEATYTSQGGDSSGREVDTLKEYLFVVGSGKPLLNVKLPKPSA